MIRLLTSGLIIFGVLAAVAGLSVAQFSDSVTIDNSTFATGTVDLQIALNTGADVPGTFGSLITGPDVSGLLPSETETFEFWLKNNTTDGPVSLDISALLTGITTTHADMNENLLVGFSCNSGASAIAAKKLSDWTSSASFVAPLSLAAGAQTLCEMTATLDTDATASGGASATFDTTFTGTTP